MSKEKNQEHILPLQCFRRLQKSNCFLQVSSEMVELDFNFGFPKFKNNLRFNFSRLARVREGKKSKIEGCSWTQNVTRRPGRLLKVLHKSFSILCAREMLLHNHSDRKTFLIINLQQNCWSISYFTIGVYVCHEKKVFFFKFLKLTNAPYSKTLHAKNSRIKNR